VGSIYEYARFFAIEVCAFRNKSGTFTVFIVTDWSAKSLLSIFDYTGSKRSTNESNVWCNNCGGGRSYCCECRSSIFRVRDWTSAMRNGKPLFVRFPNNGRLLSSLFSLIVLQIWGGRSVYPNINLYLVGEFRN